MLETLNLNYPFVENHAGIDMLQCQVHIRGALNLNYPFVENYAGVYTLQRQVQLSLCGK